MIAKSHRWQKHTLAVATALAMGLCASQALALSLGRISVLSTLGTPLLAEVEILDINPDEADSLKATAASPEAFKAAGLEFNPALTGLRVSLEKRPDGRSYLRLRSDRSINDPFVDLMLDASWASGRIVRDYTMLFDPPVVKQAPTAVTPTPAQINSVPARISAPAPSAPPVTTPTAPVASSAPPARTAAPKAPAKTAPVVAKKSDASAQSVTVKPGDTAGKIASAHLPPDVSLDQMLVAMLRANPEAFLDSNVNRIRSGAVLSMPSAEEAQATPIREAHQTVVAQSNDFNAFRSKLATSAPLTQVAAADRQASGSVQTKVDDKKAGATAPDKLTLSQGTVKDKAGEVAIAKERQAADATKKTEALSKTIADLDKLVAATAPPAPPAAPAPTAVTAAAPEAVASAPATVASAPQPAASAPVKRPVAPLPAPIAESSFIDELLDEPLVPAAAGGLVALLAGLGFYRYKKRKEQAPLDSEFMESRIQPDSFFGASGGQRIDTLDSAMSASSMMYSPSQLDSADDVDPVAEADVYLAYGRDIQAEEILKEALRMHPSRVAIHQKLLEIYAKRRDLKNFEHISKEALKLTGKESPDWSRVCELGRSIDPSNELYQSIVQLSSLPEASMLSSSPAADPAEAADLDLDLDFSLDETPPPASNDAMGKADTVSMLSPSVSETPALDLEFNLPDEPPAKSASTAHASIHDLVFDPTHANDLRFQDSAPQALSAPSFNQNTTPAPLQQSQPSVSQTADEGLLEFDLGSLSLDLGPSTEELEQSEEDPLGTKLALATEFGAIGDTDGARALIEEVIAEASGEMKAKAQQALSQLR